MTRMRIRINSKFAALLAGLLVGLCQPAAAAISIAQMPLFIAAATTPNVMILFDNSGSMNNVIWGSGFSPAVDYPDWSPLIDHDCNAGTALREGWSTDGEITAGTSRNANYRGTCAGSTNTAPTCPTNFTRGRNAAGTITKCIRIPDPATGGNTRYNGNYLNWIFENYGVPTTTLLPTTTDLTLGQVPNQTRLGAAKNVATAVVTNNSNLRIGIARFNGSGGGDSAQGGRVVQNCGATTTALTTTIAGFTASTFTPLAETYFEITRYFRGLATAYPVGNGALTYTSPIQYRCQKNFVIVITDGFPTADTQFTTAPTDPADAADTRNLPNWDGLAPPTTAAQYPVFPQYSDGFLTGGNTQEGFSLYLDDLAKFGYDIDLLTSGTDITGGSFNEPGRFQKQNLITYTIGLTVNNQMMADAAAYGTGIYYSANDEDELTEALQSAFADIEARTSSASAVATNSTRVSADSLLFQARFSTSNWAGELLAYSIGLDGELGPVSWNAADNIPAADSRVIYSYDPEESAGDRGIAFSWDGLNDDQKDLLDENTSGSDDGLGERRVAYLRGSRDDEAPNGAGFRARSSRTVLGDIINSDPAYVAAQNYGFEKLPGSEGSSYKSFRDSNKNRQRMVYVAANDGMLHAFRADTGEEVFAYVPNAAIANLKYLTDDSYNGSHRLINDGAPRVLDARIGGSWRTILVGSLGGGGRGVYALDVTEPESFSEDDILWEFTDEDDGDLGVTIARPAIARLNNGDWVALVPNGYNGSSARLFVLDLATGAKIREIDTGVGSDNGLSSPAAADIDGDFISDYVYAGDLKGNMWKFDLTSSSSSAWAVAFTDGGNPAPLWTACSEDPCSNSNRQAITAEPEVGLSPTQGLVVYFGTGRYFAVGDNTTGGGTNTFYAIRDRNNKATTTPTRPSGLRENLVEQEVIAEISGASFINQNGTEATADDIAVVNDVRVTSKKSITDADEGWFMDLPTTGERQVSTPILRNGRIIFTTLIPSGDACSAGGSSWLMEMDAASGGRLSFSPFDLNDDGEFDRQDWITVVVNGEEITVPASGIRSTEGIIKQPAIVACGRGLECKFASGSSGGVAQIRENAGDQVGRLSWREVDE